LPRKCTICIHPDREAIDRALVNKESFRYVSKQYSVTVSAIHRHNDAHLPASMTKAQEARPVTQADDLLTQVRNLQSRALSILGQAEVAGDLRTAILAIREARGNLELLAKLLGELQDSQAVNVLIAPEWLRVRGVILASLSPFPQAALALSEALGKVENAGR
jgi:hypothetical protein